MRLLSLVRPRRKRRGTWGWQGKFVSLPSAFRLSLFGLRGQSPTALPTDVPVVDFHAHLFTVVDSGSGCFLHDKQRRHWTFDYLKRLLGIREPEREFQSLLDSS